MRINKFVALATGMSRRAADRAVSNSLVTINDQAAVPGQEVSGHELVFLDGKRLELAQIITIVLNKPVGYVCSRDGQGSRTIYDLLPAELHNLKPVGRLDKDSSGLLLLTNDGQLAQQLTHPSSEKDKIYEVTLDKPLTEADKIEIEQGIRLVDGPSRFKLTGQGINWNVAMHEGRNRQIRRTFGELDYKVTRLHRTRIGNYTLENLELGNYSTVAG